MTKVFVYGTLKQGYHNNILLQEAELIGPRTVEDYKLYNAGFPVAYPSPGDKVLGELWDIKDNLHTLQSLDRLESNGFMYDRTPIKTLEGDEGEMYIGNPRFWNKSHLEECPVINGNYVWNR